MKTKRLPKLYKLGVRFPRTVLIAALLLGAFCLYNAKKLQIQTDFEALLPPKTESVQNLRYYQDKFGSRGHLVIAVEADDPDVAKSFADQFAERIEKHPEVRYVNYRRPVDFFKKRQWLYLDLADLHEMEHRIDRSLVLQKKGVSPVFNDIMDFADEENRPDLTFQDIRKKYEDKMGSDSKAVTSDEEGKMLVIWVKSKTDAGDVATNRKFIAEIKGIENQVRQEENYPGLKVGYTGEYETKIESVDFTKSEMLRVSLIVATILFLILLFYFKKISAALLVTFPLILGIIWTNGFMYFIFGHVNVITAFASAILAGLGSDYGIYLLARYYKEEEENGADFQTACRLAFSNTGVATFGSMITTVGGFGALIFSNFLVFKEFGVMGALGVFLNYLAMMLVIPSVLVLSKRHQGNPLFSWASRFNQVKIPNLWESSAALQKIFSPRWPIAGILIAVLLLGVSAISIPREAKIYFENGQAVNKLPGNVLYDRVAKVTGSHLDPTVLITKNYEDGEKTVDFFNHELDTKPKNELIFNKVIGLSSFIPKNQLEKKEIIPNIINKFEEATLVNKNEKSKLIKSLNETLQASVLTSDIVPQEVKRMFSALNDDKLYAVYLFPAIYRESIEGMNRYWNELQLAKKQGQLNFIPVDFAFVSKDIIELIDREAPPGLLLIGLFLGIVLLFTVRPPGRALILFLNLFGSLVFLSGVLYLFGIRLNIMNIGVIPIILGTGIDCFIHFNHRFDETWDIQKTLKDQLPSIFVSNLTSIVGFGGLILTSNLGLRSVGLVAALGLIIVTIICAFIFPRCLALSATRKVRLVELDKEAIRA